MKELIVSIVAIVGYGSIGAWCICGAVDSFKRNRYFCFGLNIMIAIAEAILMSKYLLM